MSNAPQRPNTTTQAVQITLALCVGLVVIYLVVRTILPYLYWIFGALGLLIVMLNKNVVQWFYRQLRDAYKRHPALGIFGILLTILVAPLVIIFLALKTLYEFINYRAAVADEKKAKQNTIDTTYTDVSAPPAPKKELPKNPTQNADDESRIF